ncbi:DUF1554 domain-containing protein [Colwelliaceae bacterium 6441]
MKKLILALSILSSFTFATLTISTTADARDRVTISSLEARINELQLLVETLQSQHAIETADLLTKITTLNNQITALKSYDNSLDASIRELNNTNDNQDEALVLLNSRIQALESAVEPDIRTSHIMFVTSQTFNGNLGGLSGADAKCQTIADSSANIPTGTYRAWLSNTNTSVKDRFEAVNSSLPFERSDGVQIASNWQDLVDGSLSVRINRDENLTVRNRKVWTYTEYNGVKSSMGADYSCGNWYSNDIYDGGRFGTNTEVGVKWTADAHLGCTTRQSLYCVQQ